MVVTMPCCSNPRVVQATSLVLLKEPPVVLRLQGRRCQECGRVFVTPAQVAKNQAAAMRAAAKVRPSPSMWRDLYRETRA